jgi:hypothetical protein
MKCDSVFWFNITGARLEERRLPGDFFSPATQLIFLNATQPHFFPHPKSLYPPVPKIHWQVSQLLAGPPAKLRLSAARPPESSSAKKTPATLLALDPQTRHKPAHPTLTPSSYNSLCLAQGLLFSKVRLCSSLGPLAYMRAPRCGPRVTPKLIISPAQRFPQNMPCPSFLSFLTFPSMLWNHQRLNISSPPL